MKTLVKVMIENKQETLLSECMQWFDNDMVHHTPTSRTTRTIPIPLLVNLGTHVIVIDATDLVSQLVNTAW